MTDRPNRTEHDDDDAPSTRRAALGPGSAQEGRHGPRLLADRSGATFRLWAPDRDAVEVVLFARDSDPPRELRRVKMAKHDDGFHVATVSGMRAGDRYAFSPDSEGPFPDPASRRQPLGVHGPSELVDVEAFTWRDKRWRGCPIEDLVIWEAHVGTATSEGTFRALAGKLDHVRALGATAIELMPIADFPGRCNWGYDGVSLFAPARAYGTPEDFAALVDAAHMRGLAVILDVVYNHFGPDGNYLQKWSKRWFEDRDKTPWGDAVNYGEDAVRSFVLENAASWIRDFHVDGLRLDATHAIMDHRDPHVLTELADVARAAASEREILLIAEDERNEARVVREVARGGIGLDAVWADDFHHEVRRIVAGDDEGYFQDFSGDLDELVRLLRVGWLYEGQTAKSTGAPRGTPAFDVPPPRFVHCIQNHDQIGNRATGDRLNHGIDLARYRAATTLLLATPFTPLLFMGEEFAASSPFAYFTDHAEELGKLVTEGRREEFARFRAFADPARRHEIPDPQTRETFERSKLPWDECTRAPGREILALHRDLLKMRREEPAMGGHDRADFDVSRPTPELVAIRRRPRGQGDPLLFVVGLRAGGEIARDALPDTGSPHGVWTVALDTEAARYGGTKPATLDRRLVLPGPGAVVLCVRRG